MNVGAVLVFEPAPGGGRPSLEDLVALVDGRLDAVPRLRQRLSVQRTRGWSWPRWNDDERFHTTDHVGHVALPAPGNEPELCEWIGDFYSHRLDRTRPLWEMALIEGLKGDRWGVAIKVHACLLDQVSSRRAARVAAGPVAGDRASRRCPGDGRGRARVMAVAGPGAAGRDRPGGAGRIASRSLGGKRGRPPPRDARAVAHSRRADRRRRARGRACLLVKPGDRVHQALCGRTMPARRSRRHAPGAGRLVRGCGPRRLRLRPAQPAVGARGEAARSPTARHGRDRTAGRCSGPGLRDPVRRASRRRAQRARPPSPDHATQAPP